MCMDLIRTINGTEEAKIASNFENIRLLKVNQQNSPQPLVDFVNPTSWMRPSESYLNSFSAICWYFGKELNLRLKVPIGLIQNCVPYVKFNSHLKN